MLYSTALPESFSPSHRDVVVGKGKKYFNHKGNQMLRQIAASMIVEYANARTKVDKSLIISSVVERIRNDGGFVKLDQLSGRWFAAEELLCREKTSAVFRDALHDYRKSGFTASKVIKRRREESSLPSKKKQEWVTPPSQPTTLFHGMELLQRNLNQKISMNDDDSLSGLTHSLSCFREEDLNFDDFVLAEF